MKELEILRFGNQTLRLRCNPIDNIDRRIIGLLDQMRYTLYAKPGSAAIAAPQIGKGLRITVIDYGNGYEELINPEIVESSGEALDYEGCLSFPGYSGRVIRAKKVTIKFLDRNGKEHLMDTGINADLARCYQHELDHFDGILYTDKLADPWLIDDDSEAKVNYSVFMNAFGKPTSGGNIHV